MTGIKNILVVVAFCELVSSAIISTPENVALHRGASTELICRANSGSSVSSWTFTAYQGSAKDVTICSREIGMVLVSNRTSFQEIIDNDEFFNIKTDSVQPHDAGVYTCNILLAEGEGLRIEKRSAHLIVLDSVPNCTSVNYSTNGRKFKRLSCSVSFRGDWAPVMEWRQGGFHGSFVTTGVQSHTLSNFVSQNISIPVDVDGENAISYTCIIFFMGNFSASATNIPNFTFIWPGIESTTTAKRLDTRKTNFIELIGALAAVVGVLVLLLMIISARNYKNYRRDSALVDEAYPINVEHLENHHSVESVRLGIRNGVQPVADECSRIRANGSSSSVPVGEKKALNKGPDDKRSCSYFAADGTEYMEISSEQNYRPQMPIRHPSRYAQVVYASIDHTLKVPLPPRYV